MSLHTSRLCSNISNTVVSNTRECLVVLASSQYEIQKAFLPYSGPLSTNSSTQPRIIFMLKLIPDNVTEAFCGSSQSVESNTGLLPSSSLQSNHSFIIVPLGETFMNS